MNSQYNYILILLISSFLFACQPKVKKLPILGHDQIIDGKTVHHTIPNFSFTNQYGETVNNEFYKGKTYVATFFFTTCPTICPVVSRQMLRIYDKYENNPEILLLSHTLDPKRDTVNALKNYAENLEVKAPKWNFVTGNKKEIRGIVDDYFNIVVDDEGAPGGINHSGKIVLVDRNGHIRSFCEGTDPDEVTIFLEEIDLLLKEYETKD